MHHLLRRIIERRCNSTFSVSSHRPALIRKTIESVVSENEVIEQPDAQQLSSFPQSCGERPILRARRRISGRMIVDRNDRSGVEEDGRFEDFTRVHKAERKCPDRDDVHADAGILGIETTDEELLTIETSKAWAQRRSRGGGVAKDTAWSGVTTFRHERNTVSRNELWNGK